MANKFKQAAEQQRVAPGGEQKPVVHTPEVVETVKAEPQLTVAELLTGKVEKKPEGKSCSFWLTAEAIANLEKFAKANGCTKSKAADIVFRNLY